MNPEPPDRGRPLARAWLPAPLLSVALLGLWLALARSTSLGQILLGLAVALCVPLATSRLRPTKVRVHKPFVVARFLAIVGYDVMKSNLEIAWDVVFWRRRQPCARFVRIPLEIRDPAGLTVLAMVTTVVPGTVWSEIALDRSALLLHVWNVDKGEEAFIVRFKARYEAPLREIFE